MPSFEFLWTDDIIEHIAEHGVSREDFEEVVCEPVKQGSSESSGDSAAWGYSIDGRYLIAVYEMIDNLTVLPVTAYEVTEPK